MQRDYTRFARLVVCALSGMALLSLGLSGCGGSGSSNAARDVPVGKWGGSYMISNGGTQWPATLQVTTSGGQMTIACQGLAQLNQPLVLDGNGHFSVTGTSVPCCTPTVVPTRFDGSVQNSVMTLTLTDTQSGVALATYTLTFGQDPPVQNFACPG